MSFTYSGDPSDSSLDKVRFLLGQTNEATSLISNQEINGILAEQPNPYLAASILAGGLAALFATKADKSVGDLSISFSQIAKNFNDLQRRLEERASLATEASRPEAGGLSISDKQTSEADTDLVQPRFKRGMHDNLAS